MNSDHLVISEKDFKKFHRKAFYKGSKEPIPKNVPTTLGKVIALHCFVDIDHPSENVSLEIRHRSSCTVRGKTLCTDNGIWIKIYGNEVGGDLVQVLYFKLRMFGILLRGLTIIL